MKLKKTGDTFPVTLASDEDSPELERTVFHIRVLDGSQWRTVLAAIDKNKRGQMSTVDLARTVLGELVESVDNLIIEGADGSETVFEFKRKPDGKITDESLSVLFPLHGEIAEAAMEVNHLESADRKNLL